MMEPKISSWSSGTIKTLDKDKKIGIIEDTDSGDNVIFTLDDLLLKDISESVKVGKTVLFEKEQTKFGREAKKITLIDDSLTK
jgi:cold shock CspA family protein